MCIDCASTYDDIDLDFAIACWETGNPIPLDLATRLMEKGYDVNELESKHMTY